MRFGMGFCPESCMLMSSNKLKSGMLRLEEDSGGGSSRFMIWLLFLRWASRIEAWSSDDVLSPAD